MVQVFLSCLGKQSLHCIVQYMFDVFTAEKKGTIEDAIERGENKRGKKLSEIIADCKVALLHNVRLRPCLYGKKQLTCQPRG